MAREFELKYRCDSAALAAIEKQYGDFSTTQMETTYYDTFDLKLSFHRWTLRKRMENGVAVCTFKSPAENGGRNEWEVERDSIEAGLPELCKLSGLAELTSLTRDGVIPVCGARFIRQACRMETEDATVELALDEGILFGGGRELPFSEMEVELKSGSKTAACRFAQILALRFGLTPEEKSKFRRALTLAQGE